MTTKEKKKEPKIGKGLFLEKLEGCGDLEERKVIRESLRNWARGADCSHEWHADQDNDCNTCIKCGARQEIYTE